MNNFIVHDIHSINSKGVHINIFSCSYGYFRHIKISAPDESPNTDGIRIGNSNNIRIVDSNIGTGDDCIAMVAGSQSINITRVTCGPGHGISIGSLGKLTNNDVVKDIHIKNCTLINTQNGVRIKTWALSMNGMATNIAFEDIIMIKSSNPIIIDQQYCPSGNCKKQVRTLTFLFHLLIIIFIIS